MFKRQKNPAKSWFGFAKAASLAALLAGLPLLAFAQGGFNSGSTGADGAFNPTTSQAVQIPESGVFNFTTITIPTGVTITFMKNSRNTPVIMLATGDVLIRGTLNLDGSPPNGSYGGVGGPGGFRGGNSGWPFEHPDGFPGEGPGGGLGGKRALDGSASAGGTAGYRFAGSSGPYGSLPGVGGQSYGNSNVSLLIGGSGGGGRSADLATSDYGGGGGGGGTLIASSTIIRFEGGAIYARGGDGLRLGCCFYTSGAGAGGAIRLIANTIQGSPDVSVIGGCSTIPGDLCGSRGSVGFIRAEAFDLTQFTPANNDFSRGLPSPAILPNLPSLRIAAVGGVTAPLNPVASLTANPDIVVPTTVSNPVTVSIQASNIPLGTVVQVTQITDANTQATVNSTPLAGTIANSTATASVTLPASGLSILTATTTLNALVAFSRPIHIDGERIDKVQIAASFGGPAQVMYITASGKRIKWPQ